MNKQSQENYARTLQLFLKDSDGIKNPLEMADILAELHRHETTLHNLAEVYCNREMTENEIKRETRTENRVKEIAAYLGFEVRFNGDPRGFAIRFVLPSKKYNTWDGETWAIDW